MKTKKILASAGIATVLLASAAPALASGVIPGFPTRPRVPAPEIDVSAGAKALAVLAGALLLAGESLRRRRGR